MANHFDEQDEPDDNLDIPGNEEDLTTATAEFPSVGEQIGPLPFPGAPPGSVPVGMGSYLPPLSPSSRMVIGQEIPQSEWLREPVRTQIPWSVLEYDRRKKELESQERMDALVRSLSRTPMASASKAIEMATQMEGRLAFDADVQAGVPISEALMKHATKMYAGSPSAQLGALKMSQPQAPFVPQAPTQIAPGLMRVQTRPNAYSYMPVPGATGPRTAEPVLSPEGETLGYTVAGSSRVLSPKEEKTLTPMQALNYYDRRTRQLQNRYDWVKSTTRNKQELADIQNEMTDLMKKQKDLYESEERKAIRKGVKPAGAQTKTGVTIRDKKTGRTGTYPGDIKDLPKDRYEIVG